MKVASILDYGAGNNKSLTRALVEAGYQRVEKISCAENIKRAENLFIPGVGSFAAASRALQENNMHKALIDYAATGRPLVGICLGMQLLANESEEFGTNSGLGLINGRVKKIARGSGLSREVLPIIDWMELESDDVGATAGNNFLMRACLGQSFYFVHSYEFLADNESQRLAYYTLGDKKVSAIVGQDNVLGLQFHPEKSGPAGIKLLNVLKEFMDKGC